MTRLELINQKTRAAYNKAAEKYQQLFSNELENKGFDKQYLDEFAKYFNSNSIIYDLGCGPCGHVANYLNTKGINVIGMDISEKCIEIAKRNNPLLQFEIGDFSKLRFNDNYLDGIISYYSIIDTPQMYVKGIMNEFNRVLKKGGYLLLVVKEGITEGFQHELLGIETEIYFSLFTKTEIETYLSESNFRIIKIDQRAPYTDEINIDRIFSISKKIK